MPEGTKSDVRKKMARLYEKRDALEKENAALRLRLEHPADEIEIDVDGMCPVCGSGSDD